MLQHKYFPLLQLVFVTAILTGASSTSSSGPQVAKKPHIFFMLVDDWGWADVGYHRVSHTSDISTPAIDSLVKEGLQLDQHYVYNYCSPSRASLLSGRLPIHVNDDDTDQRCYNPDDPVSGYTGIPRNMTVFAEKLKQAGYATHQVGKWDAGMATPDHTPKGRGFDSSFNYFHHANDYFNETEGKCGHTDIVDLWDTDKPSSQNGTGLDGYEEALFRERVLSIINNHKDPSTPLFLYYAPHIVHMPYEVPDKYLQMFSFIDDKLRQVYHAMVKYLDDNVGEIVDALRSMGLWDDLLFITSSDNGGPVSPKHAANNYPLKGGKHTDWQGGVRVNAFVSGGYLPDKMRGQKTDGYIHLADWYATFCALAGVDPTDEKAAKAKLPPIDSLNMWPLISGQNDTSPRVDIPISQNTLISGDYKILIHKESSAGWTGPIYPNSSNPNGGIPEEMDCGETGCLYNIKEDPLEHTDLAKKMEDKLTEMKGKLMEYKESHFNPDRGHVWPGACDAAMDKYGGFWGPFLS